MGAIVRFDDDDDDDDDDDEDDDDRLEGHPWEATSICHPVPSYAFTV